MNSINNFLFIGLPYLSLAVFLVGVIYRYRMTGYKYSALSSQFLDGESLYPFTMLFHIGILGVFIAHLLTVLFPEVTLVWYSNATRMVINEIVIFACGLSALIGLGGLFLRRISQPRILVVTNTMDIVVELLLFAQFILGLWTALGYRWGYYWFAADLSPYLWSLISLNPQTDVVGSLPTVIKTHMVGAFIILGLFPFTRLVHLLVAPFHYTWRSYQKVVWYWDRKTIRDPSTVWTKTRPSNT